MDDLERQIRAWADAASSVAPTDAVTDEEARERAQSVAAPPVANGGRLRWFGAAAAVLVLAIGAAIVVQVTSGDGGESVRAGEPEASASGLDGPSDEVGSDDDPGGGPTSEVTFEVLHVGLAGDEPAGTIRSARTEEQLADLWDDLVPLEEWTGEGYTPIGPPPPIDFDAQAVVSLTIPDDACPPSLESFQRRDDWVIPLFVQPPGGCDKPYVPKRFVVAIDWAPFAGRMGIELPADGFPGIEAVELLLRPNRTDQVIIDLAVAEEVGTAEGAGEARAGSELRGTVMVNNGTGEPIDITYCGAEFAAGLRNAEAETVLVSAACAVFGQIPPGLSMYPVNILTTYGTCTSSSAPLPGQIPCLPGGAIPPLPPGEYEVVLRTPAGLDAEAPPVTITLT